MNFYAVIIATEILNGRREDAHFEFVKKELQKYGHELFSSFIIKDDVSLITKVYEMIKTDKDAVIFSFGGIGSTPDDLTREIASRVFTNAELVPHKQFLKDIITRFGDKSYPHRIHMADLSPKAELLFNPINNMSGFSLFKKYFFVPGFPNMAHPMIKDVIKTHFSEVVKKYRLTLYAHTSEETLITLMQTLPKGIELSCLPLFVNEKAHVELSLLSTNKNINDKYFEIFKRELDKKNIYYKLM
ncbi:Molybdenum cofactor biosynthesis protein MoaB [hydrothermal vent metagenome]|uniref:Molybdenum cofactor biosynthesis protein MoaB n=1 Tax=hydrothermal vent metagenome TaxID=652676 RepID=A0A1W1C2A9_9ZZZZ